MENHISDPSITSAVFFASSDVVLLLLSPSQQRVLFWGLEKLVLQKVCCE
jgi:hypothetical protein